ncbi:MAG: TIR-like protein FxsC [Sciscionella sp.]
MQASGGVSAHGSSAYFFLSYAHTQRLDPDDGSDPDHWVHVFFHDLNHEVSTLARHPRGRVPGFADSDIPLGGIWPDRLSDSIATCAVFVPLFSPGYFDSVYCGREWTAFSDRLQSDYASTSRLKEAVIPVMWQPMTVDSIPPSARRIQLSHTSLGEEYRRRGMLQLLRQRRFRSEYRTALLAIARQVVSVAENAAPRTATPRAIEALANAFESTGDWQPADRRTLRIAVAAPISPRLPRGCDPLAYGSTPAHWRPYQPSHPMSACEIAERIGRALGFHPLVATVDQCPELELDTPPSAPTVLLVDPWATADPTLSRLLERFDEITDEKPWIRLALPWTRPDQTHPDHGVELASGLFRALEHTRRRCRPETPAAVAGLATAEDFGRELPAVISVAERRFLQHVKAFPPQIPRQTEPFRRPRLRGQVYGPRPEEEEDQPDASAR